MQLENARIVLTGAGSGLGLALAREASRRGARLLLVGRGRAALEDARARLERPARAVVCAADVTRPEGRAAIVDLCGRVLGGLDILVNNAGVQTVGELDAHDDEAIAAMLATNLAAPLALSRDLLALLRASAPARIVNIGSMYGDVAFPLFAGYSATKFGLRGLSDALRRELADDRIGVTLVAPRAVRTAAFERHGVLEKPFGMKVDDPAAIARRIWDAVARDSDSVYPGFGERAILLLQRLAPGVVDGALAPKLRRAREALAGDVGGARTGDDGGRASPRERVAPMAIEAGRKGGGSR